ncbi:MULTISPECIES: ABC transporter ATP-binding protein/permease [unclassified Novosphingobium]|uniref:ABCB family ABC transporter ATP-binding protein/permease n=1 Tax=unclassified Novosphingobium TaxID=2644732 RepID=UPI00144588F3|nr:MULTISPECIES: ABC transporter ATP-binding protein/permease [unclassified Novosphingobium]NKJ43461.1 ATP-binding cassette subfamily B protein [Novosphingobium sp. SG720]NMN06845.1 ATP-binding cassette subfamily B protein [Novosphingobium sp. SG919]NMN89568.1 ATP-binding cassette subfamily B protein [Novosphingobium sp. SG916]
MPPENAQKNPNAPGARHDGWHTLKRFLPYLWPVDNPGLRWRIVVACLFILASTGVQLTLPYLLKWAVDAMNVTGPRLGMLAMWTVLAYSFGRFAWVAFDNLRNIVFERVGQDATRALAEHVFAQLHRLSLRFHLARRTGEVTKTIERGTKSIDTMLYFMLFNIAPTILQLIVVAVIFWITFGWGLVAATAVAVAAYIWVTRTITEWRTHLRERMNRLDGQALSRAVDSLLNYETVKYFGAERREEARYGQAARAYAEAAITSENSLGLLNIAQAMVISLLMAGALAYTVWGWWHGRYTAGQLVFVQTYLTQLFRPLDMLGMVYRTIRQGLIDMAEMFRLIDTQVEVADKPGAPALVVRRPSVTFDNVVFGYDPDRTILHGLSFEVPAGSRVAIVGPSGAGKSTIARLLFRFYDPRSGRILIDGQDIAGVTQASLRAAIGIVPQDSVLFNDTIGYNIAYGREGATADDVAAAARGAAIADFIARLPHGLDTEVGERGLKLSGGEKQRVAIARTLVKNPPILLFDEATSALDTRTEQDILGTLRDVAGGRTTLSIAHRLSTIADSDTILVIDQGRLVEQGGHTDLLRRAGLYAEMWARQAAEGEELGQAAE